MAARKELSNEEKPTVRIRRQRELLGQMHHENEVLRLDLTRESRESRRALGSTETREISNLQEQASMYLRKIEAERRKVEDLERQIATYQERILEQKSKMGGVNASFANNQLIARQIKMLENKLDKALIKFNETLARNKVLRNSIDDARRERVVFDGIYKKLERELHEKKKEMARIIEESKNAYKVRDKAQSEIHALRQHAEKERGDFELEFKELGDLVNQQQQMLEQIRLKQLEAPQDEHSLGSLSTDAQQEELQVKSTALYTSKDKAQLELSHEQLQSYEQALQQIQLTTGTSNVDEIVTRFLEREELNFSLFNYVNDINSEIERLEHSIADMRNKIEKYRGQGMSSDSQRRKAVRELEDKLARVESKVEEHELHHSKSARVIAQLKNGIHSIFTRIGAASASVEELLGNQGVTESNMLQYLGIIEQRTSELLQMHAASQVGTNPDNTFQLPTSVVASGTTRMHVEPPSYDEISSGDESACEEDERPLTRQELDRRTQRQFTKREGKRGKSALSAPQTL